MKKIKIALIQYDIIWEDKNKNKIKIIEILNKDNEKFDWLIFPEMTLTGFSMDVDKTELNNTDFDFFSSIAKEKNCLVSLGGVVNKKNTLLTFSKEGVVDNHYNKNHLFSFSKEHEYYKVGTGQTPFIVAGASVYPAICYDLRFSYLFWNNAVHADIFLVVASWPEARRDHWLTLLKARAIENQTFVVGVNRVGSDPFVTYSGDSIIVDPMGNIVLNCGSSEGIFTTEINLDLINQARTKFSFLKDRKGDIKC